MTSTLLYFDQASVVSKSFTSRGAQTTFFATIDLVVNVLTLVDPDFPDRPHRALARRRHGARAAAGVEHDRLRRDRGAADAGGGRVFQVLRRAGNFALTRPTREVLFTVVSREDRYKAKNFIDTAVYRPAIRSAPGPMR